MPVTIRPVVETDRQTITALIRRAHLNPRNLHWSRFLAAEDDVRPATVADRRASARRLHSSTWCEGAGAK